MDGYHWPKWKWDSSLARLIDGLIVLKSGQIIFVEWTDSERYKCL